MYQQNGKLQYLTLWILYLQEDELKAADAEAKAQALELLGELVPLDDLDVGDLELGMDDIPLRALARRTKNKRKNKAKYTKARNRSEARRHKLFESYLDRGSECSGITLERNWICEF